MERRNTVTTRVDDNQKERLEFIASILGESQSETLRKAIDTLYILYHPELRFYEAVRPLSDVADKIGVETKFKEVNRPP